MTSFCQPARPSCVRQRTMLWFQSSYLSTCRYRSRVRTCTLGTSTTPQNQRNAMQTVQINWSDPSAHYRLYLCLAQQAARSLSKANCKLTPNSISDSSSPLLQVGLSTLHHPAGRGLCLSCSSVIDLLNKCSAYSDCS